MIEKLLKAIDSVTIDDEPLKKSKEDKELFSSLKPPRDEDMVTSEEFRGYDDMFVVFAKPIYFDILFNYYKAIYYIANAKNLATLNLSYKEKLSLQKSLLGLIKKMDIVYKSVVQTKDGWWYDEAGIIGGNLFRMRARVEGMYTKYIIHIPHSGVEIPDEFLDDYLLDSDELRANIYEYADYKCDKLYSMLTEHHDSIISPYSRLFFDAERFFDDSLESMHTEHRLGWYYENAIVDKKPLRDTKNKDKISEYYKAHHEKLSKLVDEKLEIFGECVIIDCHSFSDRLYWFHDKSLALPDVCIGYDEYHKDSELVEKIKKRFSSYEISINTPYSGSLVPLKHYKKDPRVKSVMIEINKKLYLEDDNITVKDRFIPILAKLDLV
jgi:N-formylglutamate amidohydrolase